MTDKELRRLRRADVLEMLSNQLEENEQLKADLEKAQAALADRKIILEESGSMAEAAMRLNGIFEAADEAAKQYVESIRQQHEEQEARSQKLLKEAKEQAAKLTQEAEQKAAEITQKAEQSAAETTQNAEEQAAKLKEEAESYSENLRAQADAYWEQVRQRVQALAEARENLNSIIQGGMGSVCGEK